MLTRCSGRLDDHLVGADAAHHVVDALAALVQVAFDFQGGKLVGHHADAPAFAVALRAGLAIGDDLAGRLVFVALRRTGRSGPSAAAASSRSRAAVSPGAGDDHPAADDRIFAEVWHGEGIRD